MTYNVDTWRLYMYDKCGKKIYIKGKTSDIMLKKRKCK